VASSSGSEDADNSPEAYNESIYIMIGVPYLTFAVFGILIYRGVKKNDRFLNEELNGSNDQSLQ
jgi:hypothetical protein